MPLKGKSEMRARMKVMIPGNRSAGLGLGKSGKPMPDVSVFKVATDPEVYAPIHQELLKSLEMTLRTV